MVNLREKPYYLGDEDIAWVKNTIAKMSDEEFRRFAFSWRGRARILENLSNLENLVEQRKNP